MSLCQNAMFWKYNFILFAFKIVRSCRCMITFVASWPQHKRSEWDTELARNRCVKILFDRHVLTYYATQLRKNNNTLILNERINSSRVQVYISTTLHCYHVFEFDAICYWYMYDQSDAEGISLVKKRHPTGAEIDILVKIDFKITKSQDPHSLFSYSVSRMIHTYIGFWTSLPFIHTSINVRIHRQRYIELYIVIHDWISDIINTCY